MLELCDALENNMPVDLIKGIVFHKNGALVCNEPRPFIADLDGIPFPARDLIPQHLFYLNLHNARYRRCFSVMTSRGCPFNCSFCAARIVSGTKYRMHSPEYVLDEMKMLVKDYRAQQLIITDDTFTLDYSRLEKICNGIIKARLGLKWFCFAQVNTVNRDILKLMKKAGCYSIGFGVESADKQMLKQIGKAIDPDIARNAVAMANAIGLKTQAFYVLGMHNETAAQIRATIAFAKKVNSTLAFFNMLVPYPGTRDFNYFFSYQDLDKIDWSKFVAVGEHCVLNKSDFAKDMSKIMAIAYATYYANPVRLLNLARHIRSLYEFRNYINAGLGLMRQIGIWSVH
jgi:radical SAM superfamily enzyme YgiQ (UPF0313 family)